MLELRGCQAGMCEKAIDYRARSGMGTLTSCGGNASEGFPFVHPFVDPVITATFSTGAQLLSALLLLVLAERGTKDQRRPLKAHDTALSMEIIDLSPSGPTLRKNLGRPSHCAVH